MKEYLESVKDFDKLVSPQSLVLHFLGPKPSTKFWKNLAVVKKSECSSPLEYQASVSFYFILFFYVVFFLLGMMTRFSKQKLAEAQEKKEKGGSVSDLLSKKKTGDASKKDSVVIPPPADSLAKHPASPTSSLEVVASGGEEVGKKDKVSGRSFLPTFWDDVDVAASKAHKAHSVEDLSVLRWQSRPMR